MLSAITPVVLTLNEEANIGRTLARLSWAKDIVVVDSGSTDQTTAIVRQFPQARLFERRFDSHAAQWNFAIHETTIATEWALAMDADYVLPDDFIRELSALQPGSGVAGFSSRFVYCVEGKPIRGGVYPPVTVLFRHNLAEYVQDGHTQRVKVAGGIENLKASILHDDRKPIPQWLSAQWRYAVLECTKLRSTPFATLRLADQVRRLIIVAPVLMFLYCLFVRRSIFDGAPGLFYSLQRAAAEAILSMVLLKSYITDHESQ